MVIVPGLAVGLLALLGVLVALGLIASVRSWLRPLLIGLASALGRVPIVGGFLRRSVLSFERTVIGWLASAAEHAERFASGWFRGLETVLVGLGSQIAGLALDVWHATERVVTVKVPRLLRAAETRLLRLVRAAERRIGIVERRVVGIVRSLRALVARELRAIRADLGRLVATSRAFVLRELRAGLGLLRAGLGAAHRAIAAAEFRIGRAEHQLFNIVGPEIRRLAGELNPVRLGPELIHWVWSLAPGGVRLFLQWLWHLIVEAEELLVAIVEGDWPPPITHATMRGHLEAIAKDSAAFARSLHDEHRNG